MKNIFAAEIEKFNSPGSDTATNQYFIEKRFSSGKLNLLFSEF